MYSFSLTVGECFTYEAGQHLLNEKPGNIHVLKILEYMGSVRFEPWQGFNT